MTQPSNAMLYAIPTLILWHGTQAACPSPTPAADADANASLHRSRSCQLSAPVCPAQRYAQRGGSHWRCGEDPQGHRPKPCASCGPRTSGGATAKCRATASCGATAQPSANLGGPLARLHARVRRRAPVPGAQPPHVARQAVGQPAVRISYARSGGINGPNPLPSSSG